MNRLPPLGSLRAFEAAARHLSFRMAADELHVTPTAISHQIRLLEQFCGQPLFRRRPRPLSLTPAGLRLYPILRDGFDSFGEALTSIRQGGTPDRLRITATNAFAARWLVPRLPMWREAGQQVKLDIIGTDSVLDLDTGEADIAIRYARQPPRGLRSVELFRDLFHVVASPRLVGTAGPPMTPRQLAAFPLIDSEWLPGDNEAPTWAYWQGVARETYADVPDLAARVSLNFREELHAIEAVIAGHGIGLCSDILVGPELASGAVRRLSPVTLPGYSFHVASRPTHPKRAAIAAFVQWALSVAETVPGSGQTAAPAT